MFESIMTALLHGAFLDTKMSAGGGGNRLVTSYFSCFQEAKRKYLFIAGISSETISSWRVRKWEEMHVKRRTLWCWLILLHYLENC
jgi:hypothetical protein